MNEIPDSIDSTLLDTEQIEMLIEAGASESMELVRELLDLYEGESRQKLEDMKANSASGDYEAMSRSAHALSGSSANVGGRLVWQLTKKMENDCKQGRGVDAAKMLGILENAHEQTLIGLREFLENYQA